MSSLKELESELLTASLEQRLFAAKVLEIFVKLELEDELSWDEEDLGPFINCSDVFMWGCGDAEEIAKDDLPLLFECIKDLNLHPNPRSLTVLPMLFCARKRKMRPQGGMYTAIPIEYHHLFDACGPIRKVGIANPISHIENENPLSTLKDNHDHTTN